MFSGPSALPQGRRLADPSLVGTMTAPLTPGAAALSPAIAAADEFTPEPIPELGLGRTLAMIALSTLGAGLGGHPEQAGAPFMEFRGRQEAARQRNVAGRARASEAKRELQVKQAELESANLRAEEAGTIKLQLEELRSALKQRDPETLAKIDVLQATVEKLTAEAEKAKAGAGEAEARTRKLGEEIPLVAKRFGLDEALGKSLIHSRDADSAAALGRLRVREEELDEETRRAMEKTRVPIMKSVSDLYMILAAQAEQKRGYPTLDLGGGKVFEGADAIREYAQMRVRGLASGLPQEARTMLEEAAMEMIDRALAKFPTLAR